MTRFAVFVEFQVEAEHRVLFRDLVLANAAASLRHEPGCRQFDVLVPEDDATSGHFSLYEIYDDASAFADHLSSEHFRRFDAATRPVVLARKIVRLSLLEPDGKL